MNSERLFVDTSAFYALMRALDIPVAFAFDRHFERAGFRRVTPP